MGFSIDSVLFNQTYCNFWYCSFKYKVKNVLKQSLPLLFSFAFLSHEMPALNFVDSPISIWCSVPESNKLC